MENNHENKGNRVERFIQYAIMILIAALVFLLFFLVRDYRALRYAKIINARELWLATVIKDHGPLTASNVDVVSPWMTFDYVNKLFGLPPDYLKMTLDITNSRYPTLSFSSYAKSQHMASTTLVTQVENAIRAYFANTTYNAATST